MKTLAISFALLFPCLISAADWPGWMGPNSDGVSAESLPALENLKELWRGQVGIGNASVAVAQGRAICLGHDGDQGETVICFDAATGEEIWKHGYAAKLMPNLHTGGPNATPLIAGDRVFTLSKDGRALCLALEDGAVIWERQLTEAMQSKVPTWGFGSSPVLANGRLLFVAGRTLALDPASGETLWLSENAYKHGYSTVKIAGPQGGAGAGKGDGSETVVIAMDGAGVSFFKATDGSEIARQKLVAKFNTVATTPLVLTDDGDSFFVATNMASMRLTLAGSQLKQEWQTKDLQNNFTNSLHRAGFLFGVDGKQKQPRSRLVCARASDGEIVWARDDFGHGSMVLAGEVFWIIVENGELVSVAADPEKYRELGRRQIFTDGGFCWTPPTVANGRLYLRSQAGEICCLGAE